MKGFLPAICLVCHLICCTPERGEMTAAVACSLNHFPEPIFCLDGEICEHFTLPLLKPLSHTEILQLFTLYLRS